VSEGRSWIVVNTHPHKEAAAASNLGNQGFDAYCPVVRKRVRHARMTRDVLRPLFPGYVFVDARSAAGIWRPILSTVGVRTLVRSGDEPSRLDSRFVEALRAREVDGAIAAAIPEFQAGQKIQIGQGPFDGTIATIIDLDEKDRLVVLMDILNRPVRVHIDARHVLPV
jgi:transcriptional antiterminator RfaH